MTITARPLVGRRAPSTAEVCILATCAFSGFAIFGSLSALSVAIPSMSADLRGGVSSASWIVVGFLMANSATILLFSKLSDELGRRWFYFGGVVAFVLLAVVCATARSDEALIVARILQGFAAASAVSNSTAVISDVFDAARLPFALSLHIAVSGAATLVGPVAGGWLIDAHGWRSIFWATIPVGVLAAGVGWVGLRHVHAPPVRRFRFDIAGAVLSILGICLLLCGATQLEGSHGSFGVAAALGGSGILVLTGFILFEKRVSEPILDLGVLSGGRGAMYASAFCTSLSFGGVAVTAALYLQVIRGADAGDAGLILLPMGLAMLLAAALSGVLQRWLSARSLNVAGAAVIGVGLIGLAILFHGDASEIWLCSVLAAIGFGEGVFMASITSRVMAGVPATRRAIANGFRSTLHNGALAVSAALVIAVVSAMAGAAAVDGGQLGGEARQGFVVAAAGLGFCSLVGAVLAGHGWRTRSR